MKKRVFYTDIAIEDIGDIKRRGLEKYGKAQSRKYFAGLKQYIKEHLATYPKTGEEHGLGIYSRGYGVHKVFYRDTPGTIHVLAIPDGRMELGRIADHFVQQQRQEIVKRYGSPGRSPSPTRTKDKDQEPEK